MGTSKLRSEEIKYEPPDITGRYTDLLSRVRNLEATSRELEEISFQIRHESIMNRAHSLLAKFRFESIMDINEASIINLMKRDINIIQGVTETVDKFNIYQQPCHAVMIIEQNNMEYCEPLKNENSLDLVEVISMVTTGQPEQELQDEDTDPEYVDYDNFFGNYY